MELLQTMQQHCPWCGERIELVVDLSAGDSRYVEDCEVCCAPMMVSVSCSADPAVAPRVDVAREGD